MHMRAHTLTSNAFPSRTLYNTWLPTYSIAAAEPRERGQVDSPLEGTAADSLKGTAEAAGTQLMYEHQ